MQRSIHNNSIDEEEKSVIHKTESSNCCIFKLVKEIRHGSH
jgi:hypothetical protein